MIKGIYYSKKNLFNKTKNMPILGFIRTLGAAAVLSGGEVAVEVPLVDATSIF